MKQNKTKQKFTEKCNKIIRMIQP